MEENLDAWESFQANVNTTAAKHWDLVLAGQNQAWVIMFSRKEGVVVEGEVDDDELMDCAMQCGLSVLALRMIQAVVLEMKK